MCPKTIFFSLTSIPLSFSVCVFVVMFKKFLPKNVRARRPSLTYRKCHLCAHTACQEMQKRLLTQFGESFFFWQKHRCRTTKSFQLESWRRKICDKRLNSNKKNSKNSRMVEKFFSRVNGTRLRFPYT